MDQRIILQIGLICLILNSRASCMATKREKRSSPPRFLKEPRNVTVREGDTVDVSCKYLGFSENVSIRWFKLTSSVNKSCTNGIEVQKNFSRGGCQLLIHNAKSLDAGRYSCQITNHLSSTCVDFWVTLLEQTTAEPVIESTTAINDWNRKMQYVIMGSIIVAAFCVVCCIVRWRFKKKRKKVERCGRFMSVYNALYYPNQPLYVNDCPWDFCGENIQLGSIIGEGEFGTVRLAYVFGLSAGPNETQIVAVKMLKDDASEKDKEDFVKEMEMMSRIGRHRNVISFLGGCISAEPLKMIVEYASRGNLKMFLRNNKIQENDFWSSNDDLQSRDDDSPRMDLKCLTSFSYQAARGMEYLASKNILHRDLAARNVLVTEDYELKIADFGLTRWLPNDYYTRTSSGRLPVKWMAPESLIVNKYTTKSDVWSYGILMWEIFSFGDEPYPGIQMDELLELPQKLQDGFRMGQPAYATETIYDIMLDCWKLNHSERPGFSDLVLKFDRLLHLSSGADYLEIVHSMSMLVIDNDDDVFMEPNTSLIPHKGSFSYPFGSDSQYASLSSSQLTLPVRQRQDSLSGESDFFTALSQQFESVTCSQQIMPPSDSE